MQQVTVGALVAPTQGVLDLLEGEAIALAGPDDVDGMWAAMESTAGHVLLLGERRHEAHVRRHAALVADRGLPVAWRVLPHGPAALVVIALQAATARLDPGLLPSFVEQLAERTWSGAWTPSVTRLEDPAPSMALHMRSVMPGGAGFLVTCSGEGDVQAVGRTVRTAQPEVARGSLYVAGPGVPAGALAFAAEVAGAGDTLELAGLALDPEGRFGTSRAVEMVAVPADMDVALPALDRLARCVVCAAAVPGEFCTYCHVRPARLAAHPRGDVL
jgi:hypothetical protein